jgi:MFS transporter, PAT family, beta-lactamase induction signal transducer AmpG
MAAERSPAPDPNPSRWWVHTTYFAEGMPYMVVRILSSVYFTDIGAKLRYIGYLNFLMIPWNLKFLWAPLVDIFGTKRRWQATLQLLLGGLLCAIAALNLPMRGSVEPPALLAVAAGIFVVMAFVAATNDIAIDAYYMEGLTDPREQAAYAGSRVLAYRLAMVFVRTGLVALAAFVTAHLASGDKYLAWFVAFAAGGVSFIVLGAFHGWRLPRFEQERAFSEGPGLDGVVLGFRNAFASYLRQDKVVVVLVFIALYRIGDEIMFSMVTPFLMRGLGVSMAQYSWLAGMVGAAGTIVGTMVGGWWIKAVGLKRAIWPITLLMNLNIAVYIWLAWARPSPATWQGILTIAMVHGYEQIASGLGSAALLVFLLRTCQREHKAAHYAIGSAIMTLFATFLGGYGGRAVEIMGWVNYFSLALAATVPSMLLLPFVPLEERHAVSGLHV